MWSPQVLHRPAAHQNLIMPVPCYPRLRWYSTLVLLGLLPLVVTLLTVRFCFCPGAPSCPCSYFACVRLFAQGRCGQCLPGSGMVFVLFIGTVQGPSSHSLCPPVLGPALHDAYIKHACMAAKCINSAFSNRGDPRPLPVCEPSKAHGGALRSHNQAGMPHLPVLPQTTALQRYQLPHPQDSYPPWPMRLCACRCVAAGGHDLGQRCYLLSCMRAVARSRYLPRVRTDGCDADSGNRKFVHATLHVMRSAGQRAVGARHDNPDSFHKP